jgi:GH25 family lysozyme M1 (1,4-beta-N-acetylmuramidase)
MREIINYQAVHPIRFWGVIILVFISISIISFFMMQYLNKRKVIHSLNDNDEMLYPNFFQRYKYLLILIVIGLTTIISSYIFVNQGENVEVSDSKYVFGIDISHYQGSVNWSKLKTSKHPIKYIFVRATMGNNSKDSKFKNNWKNAKSNGYIRGAYHYYRPNENSTKQFNNFKNSVTLSPGDLPPVLDIERFGILGGDRLREGLLNWLQLAEQEYGVKPIIYTGRTFYKKHLEGYVDGYTLWIAAYSGKHRLKGIDWTFHQFTERVRINGIRGKVDGNDFDGSLNQLKELCIPD